MEHALVAELRHKTRNAIPVSRADARAVLDLEQPDIMDVFAISNRLRVTHKGDTVRLCSIINAKSNMCGEDCGFCAQAATSTANIRTYPLLKKEEILEAAHSARANQANEFSIVTSGRGVRNQRELDTICETLDELRATTDMVRCASLGVMREEDLRRLKDAGLQHFHHNLEASKNFYPQITSTRSWESNVETVRTAKRLGFQVCCGGIFGMGESKDDRVDLAFTLQELDVNPVPLNFLNPIKGTALENARYLTPMDCLRIIAMFRLVLPTKDIFAMGGREVNLRDLQSMAFLAGANGMLIGNYLTTPGRPADEDLRMITDLEMQTAWGH